MTKKIVNEVKKNVFSDPNDKKFRSERKHSR